MLSWLKNLISSYKARKASEKIQPYYPTKHADTSKNISLDPKNDPFGLS
ncbi:MAG: hypothetical protein ACOYNL_08805 [Rickettsiales bacterium]